MHIAAYHANSKETLKYAKQQYRGVVLHTQIFELQRVQFLQRYPPGPFLELLFRFDL